MAVKLENKCDGGVFRTYVTFGETDPFSDGVEVVKVANGFVAKPRSRDGLSSPTNTHVFRDEVELAAWVRKQYTPKPAKAAKKAARNG